MAKKAEKARNDTDARPAIEWRSKRKVAVDGTVFALNAPKGIKGSYDIRVKRPREFVHAHLALLDDLAPGAAIVSLGIDDWGTTALTTLYGAASPHIALDPAPYRRAELDRYISDNHLEAVLRPHFGVALDDRTGLQDLLCEELGSTLIDLVIDDRQQAGDRSQATFDAIFPLMRPGGRYVVQGWRGQIDLFTRLQAQTGGAVSGALAGAVDAPRSTAIGVLTGPDPEAAAQVLGLFERLLVAGGEVGEGLERNIRAALPELRDEHRAPHARASIDQLEALLDPANRSTPPATAAELAVASEVLAQLETAPADRPEEVPAVPITAFGPMLALAQIAHPEIVASVHLGRWLTIERGPALIDPETFSLNDLTSGDPAEVAGMLRF